MLKQALKYDFQEKTHVIIVRDSSLIELELRQKGSGVVVRYSDQWNKLTRNYTNTAMVPIFDFADVLKRKAGTYEFNAACEKIAKWVDENLLFDKQSYKDEVDTTNTKLVGMKYERFVNAFDNFGITITYNQTHVYFIYSVDYLDCIYEIEASYEDDSGTFLTRRMTRDDLGKSGIRALMRAHEGESDQYIAQACEILFMRVCALFFGV